ncbi:MAG: VIT domain-containing protein [bacterium]|nr:VIT domain-containing protein [bacterium]
MKTISISIIAGGLIAAYASFPALVESPRVSTIKSVSIMPQKPVEKRPPGIYIADSAGNMVPMKIQRLATSVNIVGTMAVTTVDMTVYNPHAHVLEGEFETPVVEGQTVCRFALDINGKLREGVVVEKEKARVAFESVVRQKIDPALLEWTRGNTFKARIYPIPARGTRRVVIAFEQELLSSSEGYAYTLPFAFKGSVDTFDFNVDVATFGQRPSLAGNNLEGVAFMSKGRSYTAEIHRTDVVVDQPFRCAIPVTAGNTFTSVNTFIGLQYFAAFVPVPSNLTERPAPKTITLLWDVSLSSRSRDINKELSLLDAYFKKIGNTRVTLVPFSIEAHAKRDFNISNGDWSALRTAIHSMPADGGTQLGALPTASIITDLTLLVSDGLSTFGQHVPPRATRPLFAITSAAQSDHDVLRSLAEASGGSFVNLVERNAEDAMTLLTSERLTLMSVDVVSGLVNSTYPVGAINSDMLTVGGIIESENAELELVFGRSGREVERMPLNISRQLNGDTGTAIARLWAQNQLRTLSMDRTRNEAAITDLGKKFTIVTPGTSLLVLDRIQDYVRHRIEPPTSEPDMRKDYFAMVSKETADSNAIMRQRIDNVAALVAGRKSWYERTIVIDETKKYQPQKDREMRMGSSTRLMTASDGAGAGRSSSPVTSTSKTRGNGGMELANPMIPSSPAERAPSTQVRGRKLVGTIDFVEENTAGENGDDAAEQEVRMSSSHESRSDLREITSSLAPPSRSAYLDSFATTPNAQLYQRYLALRERMGETPGFYVDVSDILRDKGLKKEALRVLSNMAEIASEDPRLLRVLGQRLMQLGESAFAVTVFEDVRRMRGEEPQSFRDLGLAYAQAKKYQLAVDNLYQVVTRTWDTRFPEVELIAVNELNRVLNEAGATVSRKDIDNRLIKSMPVDMRVVLSWDADDCDMDLWVIDPRGEKCFYSNRDTEVGGHLSRDLTGGYGPEEFLLKKAPKGKYELKVHYYGDRQQRLTGPTTVTVDVYTHYGTPKETKKSMTVRVEGISRIVDVGEIAIN